MQYFPVPYPGELLYSVLARYAVHTGTVEAKQVLDDLFGDRQLTASVDMNVHLEALLGRVGRYWHISALDVVYKHTLFPLYAPFVPEGRRQAALDWMFHGRGGHIHTLLGRCAGRVKQPAYLRYCPACLQEQYLKHGEFYWRRDWQVGEQDICLKHGPFESSVVSYQRNEKHRYSPATPRTCPKWLAPDKEQSAKGNACWLAGRILQLLDAPPCRSPTYKQWTNFYRHLAEDSGLSRGRQVRYREIVQKVRGCWSDDWLARHGLPLQEVQNSWLIAMFRKHRKSFSFLEHLVVWGAFGRNEAVEDILKTVAHLDSGDSSCRPSSDNGAAAEVLEHREQWCALLEQSGSKGIIHARFVLSGGQATYAWLFRHDRDWLLRVNENHKFVGEGRQRRVDWKARDYEVCRRLIAIRRQVQRHLDHPKRWSASWYLGHFTNGSTLEKNLDKLPLSRSFLEKRAESIEEHQKRRCQVAYRQLVGAGCVPSAWRIKRLAGVRAETIRASTEVLIKNLEARSVEPGHNSKDS
ncbi:TnsD family Tn7-like transposition protein [Aestuariispira ectoiniformans]|uniref:TnsD family Tn7-like transposition protein n=1 Tax=Aestuariispira ectoiniformans TaxID=2775080 RepID=UPI00223BC5FD|nr:TnsD family Tn7-like transposition protein [Aestuariispira ectoiniformans]